mmetsp:Transcript_14749/g.28386  ORF Transcript_14749/g.28386 Transcript_14749/m.28386 type:complete len:1017 (+) Transcript_14749:284-3334(+)|eukprot:CAMPEP_0114234606 /NCGR_PEP_ID=MMETSP0058-20121206/5797_1 /TAXON_ID=36894 /ORGANISM="Pyramimonas parkeae, CCMP726" /LENGTH=1016 /DNA_ID=CAMNT_0001346293 /DNA_START=215 /DNA_END=3265 /DNA_ORIENTATION=-
MRGGQYQRKGFASSQDSGAGAGVAAAMRNAEVLFETRGVAEIKQVEERTRKEIEEKREELRQMVGNSYRDMIESADRIVTMSETCAAVQGHLASIQSGFGDLHERAAAFIKPGAADANIEAGIRRQRYATGSRVKYLVDTPEKIWGLLDEGSLLEGTERYLRALEVHKLLMGGTEMERRDLLKTFPLLHHHWPQVETFHANIAQRCRAALSVSPDASMGYAHQDGLKICAASLGALAWLEEKSTSELLTLFLEARMALTRRLMAESKGGDAGAVLCALVRAIQSTVGEAGELFKEITPGTRPHLFATLEEGIRDDALFGGIPSPESEMDAWEGRRKRVASHAAPLLGEEVSDACQQWLTKVGEEVSVQGEKLLNGVDSLPDLVQLEAAVRTASQASSDADGAESWGPRCKSVLGQVVDLWDTLFDAAFLARAKCLISQELQGLRVVPGAQAAVESILERAASDGSPQISAHSFSAVPAAGWDRLVDPTGRAKVRTVVKGRGMLGEIARFSEPVGVLAEEVEAHLGNLLKEVVSLRNAAESGAPRDRRAAQLDPHTQLQIHRVFMDAAAGLRALLSKLTSTPGPAAVEAALMLGRLGAILGNHCEKLALVLGPPEEWDACKPGVSGKDARRDRKFMHMRRNASSDAKTKGALPSKDDAQKKLVEVQEAMREMSAAAYRVWVDASVAVLVKDLEVNLVSDDCLKANTIPRGWEETVIQQDEEDPAAAPAGDESSEMRLMLPAVPSPYVLAFLFAACREIHRAGSHTLAQPALRVFSGALADGALGAYTSALSREGFASKLSEKGLLQALFDTRFVMDVLSGGDPSTAPAPERVTELQDTLQDRLDPIDWATYEPYLWVNEARYYQRGAVLLGALVQLNRVHSGAPGRMAANAETNTLNTAPPVPRFPYLPISAPTASNGDMPATPSTADAKAQAVMASQLADIGIEEGGSGLAGFGKGLGFMGHVGSKFTGGITGGIGSFKSLGSVLDGGKSAEAMASFGNMFGSTPLSGWGSSKREA